ncbi:Hpt domain-containing protein [Paragemmobacter straminiformis]|uniref:Hpt domain-containing protein n=1 Tax=Paragemmobacter straminiformis TaxID=2045119 RepID=A0A842I8V1_9RHOB|nr:Hpt domain-containing protein [Gemmobacter straminiformis]MBC2836059.1 Hpt domain-containing protein [Gemmobacter straminiformis]
MLIDWARVRELRDEIGGDSFSDVVALFLEESDAVIARIDAGETVTGAELHFLRGAALNLGFADLAESCRDGTDPAALATLYAQSKAALVAEAV